MTKYSPSDVAYYTELLSEHLNPGDNVYTIVRDVSRSGMSRKISFFALDSDDELIDIPYWVAVVTGSSFDRDRWAVKVSGCGMDMAFHVVYGLGRALYPNGVPCTGSTGRTPTGRKTKHPRCLSNDHVNGDGKHRRGKMHTDGGYAFAKRGL